jgi:hypothetical protein
MTISLTKLLLCYWPFTVYLHLVPIKHWNHTADLVFVVWSTRSSVGSTFYLMHLFPKVKVALTKSNPKLKFWNVCSLWSFIQGQFHTWNKSCDHEVVRPKRSVQRGWGELTCTLVSWRQGFKHPTRNEYIGWFSEIVQRLSQDTFKIMSCGHFHSISIHAGPHTWQNLTNHTNCNKSIVVRL